MREFRDKVAVITGAASGIGRALADRCAQERMKVVLADIEEPALVQAHDELRGTGADVLAVRTDVSKVADVEQLADKTLGTFGAVHLLMNNAGVFTPDWWIWDTTLDDWKWLVDVNLWGVVHGIRVFVPIMLKQDADCHVVNTASIGGLFSVAGLGAYSATKFAVVALSETLHHELELVGARVRVSVLCPGNVPTRILEAARNRPPGSHGTQREDGSQPMAMGFEWKGWQRIGSDSIRPERVAEVAFEGIENDQFYILTHPQYGCIVRARMEDIVHARNPTNPWEALLAEH